MIGWQTASWTSYQIEIHGQDSLSSRPSNRETSSKDIWGVGGDMRRSKQLPDLIIRGLKFWIDMSKKQLRRRKSKKRYVKKQSLTMLENWEEFTSLIRKMASTRKPSKNARKKLDVPMNSVMPCKMETRKRLRKLQETAALGITESKEWQSIHVS